MVIPVIPSGSLTQYRNLELELLYDSVLSEMSNAGVLIVPDHANDQETTFTTRQKHVDGIEALFTWDSSGPTFSYQGNMLVWGFDGAATEADTPDAAYWSTATAISMGGVYNFATVASNIMLSKWDETSAGDAQLREWKFFTDSNGDFGWQAYDESENASIGRKFDTALTANVWTHLTSTFTGGTDAANILLYKEGLGVTEATIVDDAGFADMEDLATVVALGYEENSAGAKANFFDGKMGLTYIDLAVLTPDKIKNIDDLLKGAMNLI